MTDFAKLLETLANAGVDFVLVGGVAAVAHGAARLTEDVDVVYDRDVENIQRLSSCLAGLNPYLRGAPPGLPFQWDVETIQRGLNFTLTTDLGSIDLLGEITGGGRFQELLEQTIEVEIFGVRCRCLNLRQLIHVKRAAGRPKDLEAIAELEALQEETETDTPREGTREDD